MSQNLTSMTAGGSAQPAPPPTNDAPAVNPEITALKDQLGQLQQQLIAAVKQPQQSTKRRPHVPEQPDKEIKQLFRLSSLPTTASATPFNKTYILGPSEFEQYLDFVKKLTATVLPGKSITANYSTMSSLTERRTLIYVKPTTTMTLAAMWYLCEHKQAKREDWPNTRLVDVDIWQAKRDLMHLAEEDDTLETDYKNAFQAILTVMQAHSDTLQQRHMIIDKRTWFGQKASLEPHTTKHLQNLKISDNTFKALQEAAISIELENRRDPSAIPFLDVNAQFDKVISLQKSITTAVNKRRTELQKQRYGGYEEAPEPEVAPPKAKRTKIRGTEETASETEATGSQDGDEDQTMGTPNSTRSTPTSGKKTGKRARDKTPGN